VIVDAHHHFWDPATADYPWLTDELATIRRAFGPADLAPDIQALGEVASEASGKSLTDAAALFESEKFTTAQNNIDQWLTANCN